MADHLMFYTHRWEVTHDLVTRSAGIMLLWGCTLPSLQTNAEKGVMGNLQTLDNISQISITVAAEMIMDEEVVKDTAEINFNFYSHIYLNNSSALVISKILCYSPFA